ncbi:MAG: hypothetical protein M1826_005808 [Phylliscum demangeonii]|nr:MAG: hypothetical protein M1826_005808 [Phylliscum demangeonii]
MDPSSAPLADYFWIAGVDSLSYGQHLKLHPDTGDKDVNGAAPQPVESTIDEDKPLETTNPTRTPRSPHQSLRTGAGPGSDADAADVLRRLSNLSDEANATRPNASHEPGAPGSNRSSATIRPVPGPGYRLSGQDFDQAMCRFTSERDSFLDELSLSPGSVMTSRMPAPSRTLTAVHEDAGGTGTGTAGTNGAQALNGAKSPVGSVRRHFSLRDLNSMKRQPSVVRAASIRTSKRLSNYNSVIPSPQPLHSRPNMHPLQRRFEPVLLDRYPPKDAVDEAARRGPFPDYVPMFAFPTDINIVSADERPRSTWHGFAMTTGDNSKIYGICVVVWVPLDPRAAEEVERQCEEWRRDNISNEERELAHSLGERLALERAKLSELLAKLPTVTSGSAARDALEDQISATEEKIALMADVIRPVRRGAASKIDGLTDGDTGLWIPRAYGVLGRQAGLTAFWKEWLRAVVVPMANGAILRVPPSSPKVGMWQPLERYVVNLCTEAPSPVSSKTQVEIAVRELRLYARFDAVNELPGTRSVDLYALFRALSIPNIVTLFECVLSESRIILWSSHTSMLHLVSRALCSLLYPLTWAGILIPILPARLIAALEAPCPYIVGVEKRYGDIEAPEDDCVLVDLDENTIEATCDVAPLPKPLRRKLMSLLQLAAPHHHRFGVPVGPPPYAVEAFPFDAFSSESPSIFSGNPPRNMLARCVSLNSAAFGDLGMMPPARVPLFNAFLRFKVDANRSPLDRPSTGSTHKGSSPPSPQMSPTSLHMTALPNSLSRSESSSLLANNLREKRSGHFDGLSRRSSSFGADGIYFRRPSLPFNHHSSSLSTSTLSSDAQSSHRYAPSTYAQSTLAASTIMPNAYVQPVRVSANTAWVEGHCLQWQSADDKSLCSVCDEKAEEGIYRCSGCHLTAHGRCSEHIGLVCPVAFHSEHIQAAFVRCFASLFFTYRKFLTPATGEAKAAGKIYRLNMDGFLKSLPRDTASYVLMLQQTQAFNEFIHERESTSAKHPSIMLFDQIILAKKNRGRSGLFSKSTPSFLSDTSTHLWRSASAIPPSSRFPGDYRQVTSRIPAKLDTSLMKEPRSIQGVPRIATAKARRKPIPSMLGVHATLPGPSAGPGTA